eukprot:1156531-Pelagomonas_calceolata.AAC.2
MISHTTTPGCFFDPTFHYLRVLLWRHPAAAGIRVVAPLLHPHGCDRLAEGELQQAVQGGTLSMIFIEVVKDFIVLKESKHSKVDPPV